MKPYELMKSLQPGIPFAEIFFIPQYICNVRSANFILQAAAIRYYKTITTWINRVVFTRDKTRTGKLA